MIQLFALLLAVDVAVTIDDLPKHGNDLQGIDRVQIAEKMIGVLKKHQLPPTYGFVNGFRLESEPGLGRVLERWRASGNLLGNHGYSHLSLNDTPVERYIADIERNEAVVSAFGGEPRIYRYPFLYEGDTAEKRDAVRAWLSAHKYTVAQVTIDSDDWAWGPPYRRCLLKQDLATLAELQHTYLDAALDSLQLSQALSELLQHRQIEQVLLLHIGAQDAEWLDALLTLYEKNGVRWVGLREALRDPIYALDPKVAWKPGATLLEQFMQAQKLPYPKHAPQDERRLETLCR